MTRITLAGLIAGSRRVITNPLPFQPGTANKSGSINYQIRGIDTVDDRIFAIDTSAGELKQSTDWGATWSTDKSLPADVTWANAGPILRFGDYLWMVAKATTGGLLHVYRASPQTGNTAFTWTDQLTMSAGANALVDGIGGPFHATADHLFAGEYGDPTGGPDLYRIGLSDANGAGTNWSAVLTKATWRHIHDVKSDPETGDIWVSGGDGVADPILRSTDNGDTWEAVPQIGGRVPQVVEMAFVDGHMIAPGDTEYATLIAVDDQLEWFVATPEFHGHQPTPQKFAGKAWDPGSVADGAMTSTTVTVSGVRLGYSAFAATFSNAIPAGCVLAAQITANDTVTVTLVNHSGSTQDLAAGTLRVVSIPPGTPGSPFFCAADPDTGIVYWVTSTGTGLPGYSTLWACPRIGDPPVVVDSWVPPGLLFFGNGRLWYGAHNRAPLTIERRAI